MRNGIVFLAVLALTYLLPLKTAAATYNAPVIWLDDGIDHGAVLADSEAAPTPFPEDETIGWIWEWDAPEDETDLEGSPDMPDEPPLRTSLGQSGPYSVGTPTDIELLGEIREINAAILFCIIFCMACAFIYMIFRAVWPFFRGW